jgi:hypothetical protein
VSQGRREWHFIFVFFVFVFFSFFAAQFHRAGPANSSSSADFGDSTSRCVVGSVRRALPPTRSAPPPPLSFERPGHVGRQPSRDTIYLILPLGERGARLSVKEEF